MVELRESGELESDEPIEESSFEGLNCSYSSLPTTYSPPLGPSNFPDFPPSPTYFAVWGSTSFPPSPPSFPLYLPASPPPPSSSTSSSYRVQTTLTLIDVFQNKQHEDVVDQTAVNLALFVDYLIEDRDCELNVINGFEGSALNVINELEGSALNASEVEDVYEQGRPRGKPRKSSVSGKTRQPPGWGNQKKKIELHTNIKKVFYNGTNNSLGLAGQQAASIPENVP